MLLLTATPHSGDEAAFERLLGLLDPGFTAGTLDSDAGRVRLARHFVQRRRVDITSREWGEERPFPTHKTKEQAYDLSAENRAFPEAMPAWCLGGVAGTGADRHPQAHPFLGPPPPL